MKRTLLLIATNLAVMIVLGIVASLLGVNRFISGNGLNLGALLGFAAVIGFGGAFISLLMSKTMARWSSGARTITTPANGRERWLLERVSVLAQRAGIAMPEVAIFDGEPNAFATGPSRNNALVAVSTGLLDGMNESEAEAVLAHEIAHIANGDMVTLTLIQGVVNTFVVFLSRIVAWAVDQALSRNDEDGSEASGPGMAYFITSIVCDLVFGFLASFIVMYFSRQREYRADAGAAALLGTASPMIAALARLEQLQTADLPPQMASSGIAGQNSGWLQLLSSHPAIPDRIAALRAA